MSSVFNEVEILQLARVIIPELMGDGSYVVQCTYKRNCISLKQLRNLNLEFLFLLGAG